MLYSDVNMHINILNNLELATDEYSINQSIMTIIGTVPGQRLFRPTFGANVYNLLFEPMNEDTASSIRNSIMVAIERWEPRITLRLAKVIPNYNEQVYFVSLDYIIPTLQNLQSSFTFNLSKLPD